jgi:hypothetical protein
MNAAHSPGPWGVIVNFNHWSVQTGTHHVAGGTGWGIPGLQQQMEANARLIAAAPELLAFAEWLLEAYHSDEGMPEAKHIAREARAAIAKATGEQQ